MPRIELLTSYREHKKGEIVEMPHTKCDELISLGRAKYIQSNVHKQIFGDYDDKQMTPDKKKKRGKKKYKTKTWL